MISRTAVQVVGLMLLTASTVPRAAAQSPTPRPAQRADTVVKQAGRAAYPNGGTLVAELTIGVVDGAQEYMFGNVRDVLELRDGSTLVVDDKAFAIRQYDAQGAHVRTIGRKGQGPGEYTRPGMLAELPDGRILLVDGGNVRVNVYARNGEPVESWRLAVAGGNVASSRIIVDTTGTAVIPLYVFGGGITEGQRLLRFAPDGRIADTIYAPVFAYTPPRADVRTARGSASAGIPFFPVTRSAWSPLGYMVTGVADRYAFELRVPRPARESAGTSIPVMRYRGPTAPWVPGDPVVSVRHAAAPVSVSDEQRSVEKAGVEAMLRQVDPAYRYSGPDIPRTKPPWKDLRVGEDGSIWVQLSMPGERYMPELRAAGTPNPGPRLPRWREPRVHDVFEPDGRYLGRVTIPNNVTLFRVTRDRVWGTFADEDDVVVVKRFRIDWK